MIRRREKPGLLFSKLVITANLWRKSNFGCEILPGCVQKVYILIKF